jgi:hypothetical protein
VDRYCQWQADARARRKAPSARCGFGSDFESASRLGQSAAAEQDVAARLWERRVVLKGSDVRDRVQQTLTAQQPFDMRCERR